MYGLLFSVNMYSYFVIRYGTSLVFLYGSSDLTARPPVYAVKYLIAVNVVFGQKLGVQLLLLFT